LTAYRNEIEMGGALTSAAGGTLVSPGWARYSTDGVPWVVTPPQNLTATCVGSSVFMHITASNGYATSYQWRKNGTPLSDGPMPGGSYILGTHSNRMQMDFLTVADNGQYDCVISTCVPVTSAAATLTVCYANCDCSIAAPALNVQDFSCFLTRFASGEGYANCDGSTQSPVLNVQDFSCFLVRFAAGCP
jgi:hypothetical protein